MLSLVLIQKNNAMKILMVCLGNICRSPMAEGIMRSKIEKHQLKAEVDSCGTAAYHVDDSPDSRALQTLKKHHMDISNLRGRQFDIKDFDRFDLIYTMDESNYQNILNMTRSQSDKDKVEMILNTISPNENIPVPDPYYGGQNGFDQTYKLLDLACEEIANRIKN